MYFNSGMVDPSGEFMWTTDEGRAKLIGIANETYVPHNSTQNL